MKKDVVLLTELLVADDKFNAEFFSAATEEQMYALAKTKFPDFTRDDFSQFLQKLQKASDLCEQKLSPEELAEISGGTGGLGKKIASIMLTLTAGFGLAGARPVETDAAINDVLNIMGMVAMFEQLGDEDSDYDISDRYSELETIHTFLAGIEFYSVDELIEKLDLGQIEENFPDDALVNEARNNFNRRLRELFSQYNIENSGAAPIELRRKVFRLLTECAPTLRDKALYAYLTTLEEKNDSIVYKRDLFKNIISKLDDVYHNSMSQLSETDLYEKFSGKYTIDCGDELGKFEIKKATIDDMLFGCFDELSWDWLADNNSGYTWLARSLADHYHQALNDLPEEERNLLLAMDVDESLRRPLACLSGVVHDVTMLDPVAADVFTASSDNPLTQSHIVSDLYIVEKTDIYGRVQEDLEFPMDWTFDDYVQAITTCIILGRPGPNNDAVGGEQERIIGLDRAYRGVPLAVRYIPGRNGRPGEITHFRPAIEEIPDNMITRIPAQDGIQQQMLVQLHPVQPFANDLQIEEDAEQDQTEPTRQLRSPRRDRSNSRNRNRSNSRTRED